jgi:methyl-accepting chemotaxis protein
MKLAASFGAIVIFNICFGLYSIQSLDVMNSRVVECNEWTGGISVTADIHLSASSIRRYDLNYAFATSELRQQILKNKTDMSDKILLQFEDYMHDVVNLPYDSEEIREKDRKAINAIIDGWNDYKVISDQMTAAVDAGLSNEEINAIVETSRHTYNILEEAIASLTNYNVEGGHVAMEISSIIYARTKVVVIVILVLASVFSIVIAIALTSGMRRSIGELLRVSESLRNCDLRVSAEIFSEDEFGMLANSYNLTINKFNTLIARIQKSAKVLAQSAHSLSDNALKSSGGTDIIVSKIENVSLQSQNQRNEIESMTMTMNKLSGNITETSALLNTLAQSASESVEKAKEGSISIEKAVAHMDMIEETVNSSATVVSALGERSDEIGRIVETISGISSQTNLLALNAAIEAARAGEQGKGFAVVAGEVKKLAGESRAAAEEIAKLITSIQEETYKAVESMNNGKDKVKTGSDVVRDSGSAFNELAEISVKNYEQLQGVTNTMRDMSSQTADIVTLTHNMEKKKKKVAESSMSVVATTEEQAAATFEISEASKSLDHIAQEMLNSIHQFTI